MKKAIKELIDEYFEKIRGFYSKARESIHVGKKTGQKTDEQEASNAGVDVVANTLTPRELVLNAVEKEIEEVLEMRKNLKLELADENPNLADVVLLLNLVSKIRLMKAWKSHGLIEYNEQTEKLIDEVTKFSIDRSADIFSKQCEVYEVNHLRYVLAKLKHDLEQMGEWLPEESFRHEKEIIAEHLVVIEEVIQQESVVKFRDSDLKIVDVFSPEVSHDVWRRIQTIFKIYEDMSETASRYTEIKKHDDKERRKKVNEMKDVYGLKEVSESTVINLGVLALSKEYISDVMKPGTSIELQEDADILDKCLAVLNGITKTSEHISIDEEFGIDQEIDKIANDKVFTESLVSDKPLTDEEYNHIFNLLTTSITSIINNSYLSLGISVDYVNDDVACGKGPVGCCELYAMGLDRIEVFKNRMKDYALNGELNARSILQVLFCDLSHETNHLIEGFWKRVQEKGEQAEKDPMNDNACTYSKKLGSYVFASGKPKELEPIHFMVLGLISDTARQVCLGEFDIRGKDDSKKKDDRKIEERLTDFIELLKFYDYSNAKVEYDARMFGSKMSQLCYALLAQRYEKMGMSKQVNSLVQMAGSADLVASHYPSVYAIDNEENIDKAISGILSDLKGVVSPEKLENLCTSSATAQIRTNDYVKWSTIAKSVFERYMRSLSESKRKEVFDNALSCGCWRTIAAMQEFCLYHSYRMTFEEDIEQEKIYNFIVSIADSPYFDELSTSDVKDIKSCIRLSCKDEVIDKLVKQNNLNALGLAVDSRYDISDLLFSISGKRKGGSVQIKEWLDSLPDEKKYSQEVFNMLRNMAISIKDNDSAIIREVIFGLRKEERARRHDVEIYTP